MIPRKTHLCCHCIGRLHGEPDMIMYKGYGLWPMCIKCWRIRYSKYKWFFKKLYKDKLRYLR